MKYQFFTAAALLAASAAAQAQVANGSFDAALTGWTPAGDVSVSGGVAFLTTASSTYDDDVIGSGGLFNESGTSALEVGLVGGLEDFVGLSFGSLDPDAGSGIFAFEGSAIKQTINVNAGDMLSFDFNFLTNDGANDDYAFIYYNGTFTVLTDSSNASPVAGTYPFATGWSNFVTGPFSSSGSFEIVFGIVDVGDYGYTSALSLDNVALVPEPGAAVMAGLAGLAGLSFRRRRK